ncbi:hypothetical protein AB0I10_13630 [Streptomyces sp. NPDC050636]|uniref:hypothetical protein n=1 Tax=Streptomyces sp. NPDC050636 TaxID=3154510 RepID=UPI00342356A3
MESLPLDCLYVDGHWISPGTDETIAVENPATEEVIGRTPACGGRATAVAHRLRAGQA